ncbi:MAG: RNA-guided endonuclease TnpB family protein [Eubacterium sp.]|nr:RNA-guided endonuclease TnpB family protein [Eubacterium sp.]
MITSWNNIIDKNGFPELFAFETDCSALAEPLYNAALFRIRQVFTGWDKPVRSENEQEVFDEIRAAKAAYPSLHVRRVLKYNVLEKIMRATDNPDFFAGLPMQTAQSVVRKACQDFQNWLAALRDYRKFPGKYTGKPRMPRYKKTGHDTFTVTNQDAVLYRTTIPGQAVIKLPGIPKKKNVRINGLPENGTLRQVTFRPYYGRFFISFAFDQASAPVQACLPEMAGVDFGTDNIIAAACTDGSSLVCKGGAVKSCNQLFAKKKAAAVSAITAGTEHRYAHSKHLDNLSFRHDCWTRDFLHKVSTLLISWCLKHHIGTLVLGVNKLWKQKVSMGRQNNQMFAAIPFYRLRMMIIYKAAIAGITVVEQEESYTSRADCSAGDIIPVYGQTNGSVVFSGRRVSRGLYKTCAGYMVNADCNGAANILRKAFPEAWETTTDFRFLGFPETISFTILNQHYC